MRVRPPAPRADAVTGCVPYPARSFGGSETLGVPETVLIGVGSNQGDSVRIVRDAIEALRALAGTGSPAFRASSLWRTSPVDCPPDSPLFINAAVAFPAPAGETPESLLGALKTLEERWGRTRRNGRNAPRLLDLDLLVHGDGVRNDKHFILPHPRSLERRFVLAPAAEVAPELIWPGTAHTIAVLERALDSDEHVERIAPPETR